MKYRIGILEVTPAELAEATMDGSGKFWGANWIARIQKARELAHLSANLYHNGAFSDALRLELAAIGVEMVED